MASVPRKASPLTRPKKEASRTTQVVSLQPKKTVATKSSKAIGMAHGFRSGLEEQIARQLTAAGVPVAFEEMKIVYIKPEKTAKYTPDFELPNGIIIESKGRFLTEDRQKHLLVKAQHPDKDIRFVFSNSKSRISKTSPTSYAMWCEKNGFKYADKFIPVAWLSEPKQP
jgi:hypothetical protein